MKPDANQAQIETAQLEESTRFAPQTTRRDFLGLAAIWSALITFSVAAVGALRLPMPAVFPESNPKVKIGPPEAFARGSKTHLADLGLWIFRDDDGGIYAISSVCTHLGCIVQQQKDGQFLCPCHGSVFTGDGKVAAGPAPGPLNWIEMSVAPDGQIVVNKMRTVRHGERLMV